MKISSYNEIYIHSKKRLNLNNQLERECISILEANVKLLASYTDTVVKNQIHKELNPLERFSE